LGGHITRFLVGGASKRGWTTWLTAAVDSRVAAIAPMVIDMLNMNAQAEWAQQMYGGQSEQINAYTKLHLTERMDPAMVRLRNWVDPYSYRARYTMPKLLLLGTDDPYWVVDSLRHYWNGLPDPKLVFQTPNAGHDLAGGREAIPVLAAFFQMIADHQTPPRMTWEFKSESPESASVTVNLSQPAQGFKLWTAVSTNRDFRASIWSSANLAVPSQTHVTAKVERPETGFRAYLVEAEMKASTGDDYKLSTEARVIPDGPPGK
jgi:PhoPQ-activated pathogenicity-related protein